MMALEIISWILLAAGTFFSIVGGIGIVRMPEFFSRMHGGGITDTLGAGLIVIGLVFQPAALLSLTSVKLLMILFFLTITSPSSCHALAKSALTHGLKPELDVKKK